jgi:hypothetical protein
LKSLGIGKRSEKYTEYPIFYMIHKQNLVLDETSTKRFNDFLK